MTFKNGDRVRMRNDPGRIGTLTGQTRERAGVTHFQVSFSTSQSYIPEDQLECVTEGGNDPISDLSEGRLAMGSDLRHALVHVRLTGRLADIIYSMEATDTTFYAYQFKPVVKLLQSAGTGILIADEVGLGKTIEAGLIWTELRSRFDFRRLFVLCPAMLREKWRRELSRRFGVEADILGAREALERLQDVSNARGTRDFAIIASMQGMRPPTGWDDEDDTKSAAAALARLLVANQHEEPLIDLLVIDEAHYLRNPETSTAKVGRLLRKVSAHAVLLSATPVHLKSDDLFQLMNLVDEDLFTRRGGFDQVLTANAPLVAARDLVLSGRSTPAQLMDLLNHAAAHPLLQGNRQLASLLQTPPSEVELRDKASVSRLAYRLELVNLLGMGLTRTRKREVMEFRVLREPSPEAVAMSEPERRLYEAVTATVRRYCALHAQHEGFLLVMPQRQVSSCMPAALRHWLQLAAASSETNNESLYEDFGVDNNQPELGPVVGEIVRNVQKFGTLEELWRNDSKYARFRTLLRGLLRRRGSEKVVVFSYFRPTLQYLAERLAEDGISSTVLVGGGADKDEILASFASPAGPSVLLSSEVGSEGIDLQFAWILVNYDLPWNPMRVEQRIGRLDRIGQESNKIVIWNLFYQDTIDARIYDRLYERLNIFRSSLGALEPILGEQLRVLTLDLLSSELTPQQERDRIDQTALAVENTKLHEEKLEADAAHLVAYGDYILNQVKAAHELSRRVTGEDLKSYVTDFMAPNYPGTEVTARESSPLDVEISLSAKAKFDLSELIRHQKLASSTRLCQADPRPVRCRFENTVAAAAQRWGEVINQFHPLVRLVALKVEALETGSRPAVALVLPASLLKRPMAPGEYLFAVQRWSFQGLQALERLHYTAGRRGGGTPLSDDDAEVLVLTAAMQGSDWLEARTEVDLVEAADVINNDCFARSDKAFNVFSHNLDAQNADRADIQERSLDVHLREQEAKLNEVLAKHRAANRPALVRATEGRIAALRGRVEQQRVRIASNRLVRFSKDEVAAGLIRVVVG